MSILDQPTCTVEELHSRALRVEEELKALLAAQTPDDGCPAHVRAMTDNWRLEHAVRVARLVRDLLGTARRMPLFPHSLSGLIQDVAWLEQMAEKFR